MTENIDDLKKQYEVEIDDLLNDESSFEDQTYFEQKEYELPKLGACHLRLVEYIETGKHTNNISKKDEERVRMTFEVTSPWHIEGKDYPITVGFELKKSSHEKATYRKLLNSMIGGDNSIHHMAQMLGKEFLGTLYDDSFTSKDGKEIKRVTLKNPDTKLIDVRPPYYTDQATGETKKVAVNPAKSNLVCFLWNKPTKGNWDALYIDGTRDDGSSKNWLQEYILKANNFKGSALQTMLAVYGEDKTAKSTKAASDVSTPAPAVSTEQTVPAETAAPKAAKAKTAAVKAVAEPLAETAPVVEAENQAVEETPAPAVVGNDIDAMAAEIGL